MIITKILDKFKIPYEFLEFEYQDEYSAKDIAEILNLPLKLVYKTLVTVTKENKIVVFVLDSENELDLKKAAKLANTKSIEMLKQKDLLNTVGYMHGGCSPIGMKKKFMTFFDIRARQCAKIIISAGLRGKHVLINPDDIHQLIDFEYGDICREKE